MKTAISLPDNLFMIAEEFARERSLSRSELYATALREYIDVHRGEGLTDKINQICMDLDSGLPSDIAHAARSKLLEAEW